MEQVGNIMESEEEASKPPENYPGPAKLPGRLIIQFLQEMKAGATMREIVEFLSAESGKDTEELTSSVVTTLENGTALGFLERKGSQYLNWAVREACGKKRPRKCCRRKCCRKRPCCKRKKRCCKKKPPCSCTS